MDSTTAFVLNLLAGAAGVVVMYYVIRNAVTAALKAAAVWKAEGGVQAVFDEREFARTGIRPKRPTEG